MRERRPPAASRRDLVGRRSTDGPIHAPNASSRPSSPRRAPQQSPTQLRHRHTPFVLRSACSGQAAIRLFGPPRCSSLAAPGHRVFSGRGVTAEARVSAITAARRPCSGRCRRGGCVGGPVASARLPPRNRSSTPAGRRTAADARRRHEPSSIASTGVVALEMQHGADYYRRRGSRTVLRSIARPGSVRGRAGASAAASHGPADGSRSASAP